jgi:hypothetical protein
MGGFYQTKNRQRVIVPRGTQTYTAQTPSGQVSVPFPEISVPESVRSFRTGIQDPNLATVKNDGQLFDYLSVNDDAVRITAPYDTGHEFDSTQCSIVIPKRQLSYRIDQSASSGVFYDGRFVPQTDGLFLGNGVDGFPQNVKDYSRESDLNIIGSKLIASSQPTRPEAGLSQAVLELKDGLPSFILADLFKRKGRAANTIGGEFLNYEFGLLPLASDIIKTAEAVLKFNQIRKQYEKDSGKVVRRKRGIPDTSEVSLQKQYRGDVATYGTPNWNSTLLSYLWQDRLPKADISLTQTYNRSVWFSGAFTYYLASGTDFASKMERYEQLANKLLGTRITPSVIWELTPWSWLVDWFSDVGVFINNVTAFQQDGLVMRYGYLMCEEVHTTNIMFDGIRLYDGSLQRTVVSQYKRTRKRRLRATPYGFGINLDSLSGGQWAILAALGLTKAPKTLR